MSGETEISLGPVKLKGKDAFLYLGWLCALGSMGYAAWGPPNTIKEEQVRQAVKISEIKQDLSAMKADVSNIRSSMRPFLSYNRRDTQLALDQTAQTR